LKLAISFTESTGANAKGNPFEGEPIYDMSVLTPKSRDPTPVAEQSSSSFRAWSPPDREPCQLN
jgi:hypothetical protein